MKKKMYLVKREVYAHSITQAMHSKGSIYSIELAEEKYNEKDKSGKIGFENKKLKKKA